MILAKRPRSDNWTPWHGGSNPVQSVGNVLVSLIQINVLTFWAFKKILLTICIILVTASVLFRFLNLKKTLTNVTNHSINLLLNAHLTDLPPCSYPVIELLEYQVLVIISAIQTARINLSPFTKDFRVWVAS